MQRANNKIEFHYLTPLPGFANRQKLKSFLNRMVMREKKQLKHVSIIFCSDEYLLNINQNYLKHDDYTDIITFQFNRKDEPVDGEIYISTERVRENAVTYQTSLKRELHRVIFHGILHLCGFKDKSAKDTRLMRKKEEEYLNVFFVPRGTSE